MTMTTMRRRRMGTARTKQKMSPRSSENPTNSGSPPPQPKLARRKPTRSASPARLLLFCVTSRIEWERAGITRATVTTTVVRGLERDVTGGLTITRQGRAVLAVLLMEEDE
jgi:hypothetical protein